MSESHEAQVKFLIKKTPSSAGERHEGHTCFKVSGINPTAYERHQGQVLFEIVEAAAASGGEVMMQQVDG
jgi:hypothetical protein